MKECFIRLDIKVFDFLSVFIYSRLVNITQKCWKGTCAANLRIFIANIRLLLFKFPCTSHGYKSGYKWENKG